MTKFTVSCNFGEYCIGVFNTEKEADSYRAKLIRQDELDAKLDMEDDEVLEEFDVDGYYRTMKIAEPDR